MDIASAHEPERSSGGTGSAWTRRCCSSHRGGAAGPSRRPGAVFRPGPAPPACSAGRTVPV